MPLDYWGGGSFYDSCYSCTEKHFKNGRKYRCKNSEQSKHHRCCERRMTLIPETTLIFFFSLGSDPSVCRSYSQELCFSVRPDVLQLLCCDSVNIRFSGWKCLSKLSPKEWTTSKKFREQRGGKSTRTESWMWAQVGNVIKSWTWSGIHTTNPSPNAINSAEVPQEIFGILLT